MHMRRYVLTAPIVLTLLIVFLSGVPTLVGAQNAGNHVTRSSKNQQNAVKMLNTAKNHVEFVGGVFTLTATEIIGQNAHLALLPNLLEPVLSFSSSTIYGFSLSHPLTSNTQLVISASGTVTATGVSIKTSTVNQLKASGSIPPADLAILLVGGTVSNLDMKNVNLQVDTYIQSQTQNLQGFQLKIVSV